MKKGNLLTLLSEIESIVHQKGGLKGLCFLLGAGADISSGGITFSDLKKRCLSKQGIVLPQNASQLTIDNEFNDYFRSLDEERRSEVLESILRETRNLHPSDGYKLIALMAREKILSSVITTNFDNLIEQTENDMGISAFQVYSPGVSIPTSYLITTRPSKTIYLKMHGDVDGKCVTHITNDEIKGKSYQEEYELLFQHLITNSTLVVIGYSGFDYKIAEIFQQNIKTIRSIYWCNPSLPNSDAPLVQILQKENKIEYIQIGFEDIIEKIAGEIFKDRMIFHADSIFIWSLFKAKINNLQEVFKEKYNMLPENFCTPRFTALRQYDAFLKQDDKKLFVLIGEQGIGKSVFISQIFKRNEKNDLYIIPITAPGTLLPEASEYLVENLGYLTSNPIAVIYQMAEWLRENEKNVIFVFDSIGNESSNNERIADYLNKIIELSFILHHIPNIRFLVSLRNEVWEEVVPSLDQIYLRDVLWTNNHSLRFVSLYLEGFTDEELDAAFRTEQLYQTGNNVKNIPTDILNMLRIPYFFGLALKEQAFRDSTIISSEGLLFAIEQYITKQGLTIGQKGFLQNLAEKMLETNDCNLANTDYEKENIKHLNHIINVTPNSISFCHPLFFEFYVIRLLQSKDVLNISQYLDFNWLSTTFLSENTKPPITEAFVLYLSDKSAKIDCVCHFLEKIAKQSMPKTFESMMISKLIGQVLENWAVYRTDEIIQWVEFVDYKSEIFKFFSRRLVYSTAYMDDKNAYKMLSLLRNCTKNPIQLECWVMINDRFSTSLRNIGTEERGIFEDFGNVLKSDSTTTSLVQLIWLMGKIGPDNTNLSNYERIASLVKKQIRSFDISIISKDEAEKFKQSFIQNAYMIFFNANQNLEEKFYCFSAKSKTTSIINALMQKKGGMSFNDLQVIRSCVDHFDDTIDFFVCNLLFVLSMLQNPDRCLENFDKLYNNFGEKVNVLELDFYLSALFMSCYISNPQNREPYLVRFKRTISDYETLLFSSPSEGRISSRQRFSDQFDLEFEDGFNALTNYTYIAPSVNYRDGYEEKQDVNAFLCEYWRLMDTLELTGNYKNILRLLHAISQMIVNWPNEGFDALKKFTQIKHPLIHRGIIKVLSQNYLRYPTITKQFLYSESSNFDFRDFLEIQANAAANIEYRTLEQLQWARILYFLRTYINKNIIEDILSVFLTVDTLETALIKIISLVQSSDNDE